MTASYESNLDLNLLRVFVVVAETGSVTAAAGRLYLTQPGVSAALRRLTAAVGAPLFVRASRGVTLTDRGRRLLTSARPLLEALTEAALSPATFDARTSERTVRIGLSDASELWLLGPLLRGLAAQAPRMRLIVIPVQFRNVVALFHTSPLDLAVTAVADSLPADIQRQALFSVRFACLFDPRHAHVGERLTRERYLAHDHVVVSYNGDLRGIVEDRVGIQRRVRVSLPDFHSVGMAVAGTALLATVPERIAEYCIAHSPSLRASPLPFAVEREPTVDLLWRRAAEDDEAVRFIRGLVLRAANAFHRDARGQPRSRAQRAKDASRRTKAPGATRRSSG